MAEGDVSALFGVGGNVFFLGLLHDNLRYLEGFHWNSLGVEGLAINVGVGSRFEELIYTLGCKLAIVPEREPGRPFDLV